LARREGIGKSSAVNRREPVVWAARALWVSLPLTLGWAVGDALAGRTTPVRAAAMGGAWALWAVGLVAVLVPTTVSLTVIRLLAPGAPAVAVASLLAGARAVPGGLAVAHALAAAAAVFTAELGQRFAQGSAYGDEARFPLRPPGLYAAGPMPAAWAVLAGCLGAGPLLLAARQWLPGAVLTAVGLAIAVPLGRRFHRLSRRWLVVVPAGVVVHDQVALAETALFRRAELAGVGLAPAGTTATDLTVRALGLAVQIDLRAPVAVAVSGVGRAAPATATVSAVLVTPSRPGRVLEECRRRGFPVR
jgi:hypothetical protein